MGLGSVFGKSDKGKGRQEEQLVFLEPQQGAALAQPLSVAPPLWVPPSRQDEQARLSVEIPLEQECRQLAQDVVQQLQQQAAAAEQEAAAAHAASQHASDRPAFDAAQEVAAAAQKRREALTEAVEKVQTVQSILHECVTQVGGITCGCILLRDAQASLKAAAGLSGEQLAAEVGALLSRVLETCSIGDMLEVCVDAGLGFQLTVLLHQCPNQELCSAEAGQREAQARVQQQEAYLQQRHQQQHSGGGGGCASWGRAPEPQLIRVVDGAGPSRRAVAVEGWPQVFEAWRSKTVDMSVGLKYIAESAAIGLPPSQRDVLVQLDRLARLAHEGKPAAQSELERAVMANVATLSAVMEKVKVLVLPACIRHVVCKLSAGIDDLSLRCKDLVHRFTGASIALDTAGQALEQGQMPPAAATAGSGAECPTAAQLMQQCHSLACVVLNPFVPDVATCLSSGGSADEKRQLVAAISTGAHRDRLLRQLRQQVEQALSTGQQWVRGSVALQQQMMHESLRQGAEVAQMLVAVFQRDGQETRQQAAQHFQATSAHLRRHDACLAAIQEQLAAVQQQQQQTAEQNAQFQQAWLAAQRQQMMAQQASATPQQSEAALPAANQPWR